MPLEADQAGERRSPISPALLLTGLTVLAFALRFGRLGHWGFDSDEIFMLRDSLHPKLTNPRPLLYYLNHLLANVLPLDEFGLRLLPAVFGVLAVPAFYLVGRRLVGVRSALLGTLFLTLNATHVIYSQFGRYWSLVFLLTAIYPYALYVGVRERDRGAIALGVATGLLACLAHPTSVLLVGGPLIWLLTIYLRPPRLRALWSRPRIRWAAAVLVVLLVVIASRFVPVLHSWITEHDRNPGSGQFLLRAKAPMGVKQVIYLLAFLQGLSLPVVLTAVAGLYVLWRERDRVLAKFLVSLALFPMLFLVLISVRTPISTYYLFPTASAYFLCAGVFLDRIFETDWHLRPRWLLPTIVVLLMLIPDAPTLVSQYLNGRRYDFKGAATWLRPRLTSADIVFSDQPVALAHYLPLAVQRLRYNTAPLEQSARRVALSGHGAALWIVAPAPAHAFRTNLRQGGLARWMWDHCQLRNSVGEGRVDFRQQYLQVFRCPPEGAPAASAEVPAAPAAPDSTGG